jgi:PAS domain S-box-containing protein
LSASPPSPDATSTWLAAGRHFEAIVAHLSEAVLVTEPSRRLVAWLGAATSMFGFEPHEALGKTVVELLQPRPMAGDDPAGPLDAPHRFRVCLRHKDGHDVIVDCQRLPIRERDGQWVGSVALCRDVTRQLAEATARREHEARYRTVVDTTTDGLILRLRDGTVLLYNDAAARIMGISQEDFAAISPHAPSPHPVETFREDGTVLPPSERPTWRTLAAGAPLSDMLFALRRPDGSRVWLSANSAPLFREGETSPYGAVTSYRDVTAERAAHAAVADREERLRLALTSSGAVEWEWNGVLDRVVLGVGWAELIGEPPPPEGFTITDFLNRVHPHDRAVFEVQARALIARDGGGFDATFRVLLPDGELRRLRARGRVVRWSQGGEPERALGTAMDVTAYHALQEQLLAATRLASVGTLAAGVAHEINNPLLWLLGNLEWALDELPPSEREGEIRRALREALDGGRRVAGVVKAMRALGRPAPERHEAVRVDLRQELLDALNLSRNQITQRARLRVDIPDALPPVRAGVNELGRVFLNLLQNAAQAIPEGDPEGHEVRVRAAVFDGTLAVEVRDSGVGMSPEVRARAFEAFFTTKPQGVGMGLGLSIARNIVEAVGGSMTVESAPGVGTAFNVRVPVASGALPSSPPPPIAPEPEAPTPRRRVMIIDDEPLVGQSLLRMLSRSHDVSVFTTAHAALRAIDGGATPDAILCDLMMPELDGAGFWEALADRAPSLRTRVVFLSGGVFGERAAAFEREHDVRVLSKPVSRERLLAELERRAQG